MKHLCVALLISLGLLPVQHDPRGWKDFPVGENVFVVERRPQELAVFLPGHPEHAATVPVDGSHDLLHIRYGPQAPGPLRVEYSGQYYCLNYRLMRKKKKRCFICILHRARSKINYRHFAKNLRMILEQNISS